MNYEIESLKGLASNGVNANSEEAKNKSNSPEAENVELTTSGYKKYKDVSDAQTEAVNYATERGYLTEYKEDTFDPDGKITKAQMAQVLYSMAGKPEVSGTSKYSDVTNTAWYSKAIIWASEQGLISGDDSGKYNPGANITNEEALGILRNYAGSKSFDTNGYITLGEYYQDAGSISGTTMDTYTWAVDNKIYQGSTLNPRGEVTRGSLAGMLMGFDNAYSAELGLEPINASFTNIPNINDVDNTTSTTSTPTPSENTQKPSEAVVNKPQTETETVVVTKPEDNKDTENIGPAISSDEKYTYTAAETGKENTHTSENIDNKEVTSKYKDVSGDVAVAANYVSERGIMVGTGGDKFSPDSTLTRAQLIQTLYAMSGKPYTGINNTFNDVVDNSWYGDAVTWAQNVGLVAGYPDGTFRPNQSVTKEEMTTILKQYANLAGKNTNDFNISKINGYNDSSDASNYARESLAWASEKGIIDGTGTNLNPKAELTRGELATALMVFDQGYNNGTGRVSSIKAAKTNPNKKVDDAAILNAIQQRYNSMPGKPYKGMCGALVCDMLQSQGLISDSDRVSNGCDQAAAFARNGKTSTGYKVIGYPMNKDNDKAQFEKMIADNNGSVENVVVSIAGYSGVNDPEYGNRGPAGHVILISKIEGGNVYFIDNWKLTNNKPTKMSIAEFEHKVFDRYGDGCYMAVVTNQKV